MPYKEDIYSYCGECVNNTSENSQNQPNIVASITSVVQNASTTKISTSKISYTVIEQAHKTSTRKKEQKAEKLTTTLLIPAENMNIEHASTESHEEAKHKNTITSQKNVLQTLKTSLSSVNSYTISKEYKLRSSENKKTSIKLQPENPQLTRIAINKSNDVRTSYITTNFTAKTNDSKSSKSTILYSSQQSSSTNKNKTEKEATKSGCLVVF